MVGTTGLEPEDRRFTPFSPGAIWFVFIADSARDSILFQRVPAVGYHGMLESLPKEM
jgi:hypothetical protein